ncbi:MAG: sigma 54-interacting transcriptional regulator [Alicyclobacillus sp.]|nr:sigma 54-interacting transcriptional regulator [Alicyclobacillus sp.]
MAAFEEMRDVTAESFVVVNELMMRLVRKIDRVAHSSATVLLTGESGVGKEMVAREIHRRGVRAAGPFVKLNCGAIPENLLESELFGYERGAFTGADPKGKIGYFVSAHRGILFLDEITELPYPLQAKLLRVIQDREVTPLGGLRPQKVDIQIIAATNRNLQRLVSDGQFREDLYYRINVVPIHIPPLRERREDIPALISHFLRKFNVRYERNVSLDQGAIERLKQYSWPGNVRELENVMERLVILAESDVVDENILDDIVPYQQYIGSNKLVVTEVLPLRDTLESVEEQLILLAMRQYQSISGAARALGISQPTMSRKYHEIKGRRRVNDQFAHEQKREILEAELTKQLSSVALVAVASLNADEVVSLAANITEKNPIYHKLRKRLTSIREHEGRIHWCFIWTVSEDGKIVHLVSDERLPFYPGQVYEGPPPIMESVFRAWAGQTVVSPKYKDDWGEWRTSLVPIKDPSGRVVAVLGSDYSLDYIETEIVKLTKMLNLD